MKYNVYVLCMILAIVSDLQANVFSDTWNKTKETAQSAWNKAKQGWDELDENAKNAIIAGGAVAGSAALAGAAYYGYDQYNSGMQTRPAFTQDKGTFDELVSFLSTDPNYANNPNNQKLFLNRFKDQGLTEDEMRNILDIVAVETAPPVPSRDY